MPNTQPAYFNSVLDAIGRTPLVRLNRIVSAVPCAVLAKLEFLNPGGSVKDRIGFAMIEAAERAGRLKPGGIIVEATSGNTGTGLAMAAAIKGYRCIFVVPDKASQEKVRQLRAFGARVIVAPAAVEPDDPRSCHSIGKRIAAEIPNSVLMNHYHNPWNVEAHYHTTGPEIWQQTAGRITVLVAGIGTGGTISGAGRYLKEQNPDIKIIGVEPAGSLLSETWQTGHVPTGPNLKTYKVEGIGEDFLSSIIDLKLIDEIVQVGDQESFLTTRRLARDEGLFCGGSSGAALVGLLHSSIGHSLSTSDLAVVILPDSGARYLSKVFDDEWMREHGFLESAWGEARVGDVLSAKPRHLIVAAAPSDRMREIIERMKIHEISQMPVLSDNQLVGMITESTLLAQMSLPGSSPEDPIAPIISRQVTTVSPDLPVEALLNSFGSGQAVVVVDRDRVVGILTKIDLIDYLAARMKQGSA